MLEIEEKNNHNDMSVDANLDAEKYMVFETKGSTVYSKIDYFLVFILFIFLFYYFMYITACFSEKSPISSFTALTIPLLTFIGLHLIDNRTVKTIRFIDGGIVDFVLLNKKNIRIDMLKIQKLTYSFGLIILIIDNKKNYFNCRKIKNSYLIINEISKMANIKPGGDDFFNSFCRIVCSISGYMLFIYALMFQSSESEKIILNIDGNKQFIASNTIGELRIIPKTTPIEEIYKPVLIYKLPGMHADNTPNYKYAFLSNQVVYCPEDGSFLAVVDDKGKKRQISLKTILKKDESVLNISAYANNNILINTCLKNDNDLNSLLDNNGNYIFNKIKPTGTFILNINNGKIIRLTGFIQANSNSKFANYAALETNKKTISVIDKYNHILNRSKLNSELIGNWDYDGVNNMIGYITNESRSVILINLITKKTKKIEVKRGGYDISLLSDTKQIWVSTTGTRDNVLIRKSFFTYSYTTFDYNNEVAVYDYEGRYLGVRIKADATGYSVKPMMNVNNEHLKLYDICNKLSKKKNND